MFLHVQAFIPSEWIILIFFKHLYSTKCAPFLLKIIFIANLSTFGSNMFLTLKIMDFEYVALIKVVHIYVMEAMNTKYI
jgi:hypothetical protein